MATNVTIFNRNWMVNGEPINKGKAAQGRACNIRAIQGAIHDYNAGTRSNWAYPNEAWNENRNNSELVTAMDTYASRGLNMMTVGLMGGHPRFQCNNATGIASRDFVAYNKNGSMRADFKTRVENIINKADAIGMFISVQLFYQNPAGGVLDNNAAYLTALSNAVTWLKNLGKGNVLIELANEVSDGNYQEATVLQPANIPARMDEIHAIWPAALATVCMSGGSVPSNAILSRCDWVSFHANSLTTSEMRSRINTFCGSSTASGKPIVVTEDPGGPTDFNAAISAGAGYGYYEQGCEFAGDYNGAARYRDGFQSPPINWQLSNNSKRNFFDAVAAATGH